ncbi:MAG TPA: amidohydrolase family protein [Candidatus Udaeobacter sp.]|nr:amidohydrolase family protein [Candidatus Udaeobacter sp.]
MTIERKWFPLTGPVRAPLRRGPVAEAKVVVDPLDGPKLALAGRVVTMDDAFHVEADGVVYVEKGSVVAVRARAQAAPAGFETTGVVETGGTLFPGLIELHNHLSYNALPLWQVPKKYVNRDQWSGIPEYRKLISGPMRVIGQTPELVPALVRYVECKCLLGGVTTSQGIQLYSNAGIRRFYRGLIRNVENTADAELPDAATRVDDIEANKAELFFARLAKQTCFLLHLSEGTNSAARDHFLALHFGNQWAITAALVGIHAAALTLPDFSILGEHHGAMVWSPFSNFLLYGDTAGVVDAKNAGVRIGIGPDWSPSGSKNLLGELKVAWLVSKAESPPIFTAQDIIAMATRVAAKILQWDKVIGTIEPGKRADLLVLRGKHEDPYEALIKAHETDLHLVMINGVARYGTPALMAKFATKVEKLRVGGKERALFLTQKTADAKVDVVSLEEARSTLSEALHDVRDLAHALEHPSPPRLTGMRLLDRRRKPEQEPWYLALDELDDYGVDLRPRLPLGSKSKTGPSRAAAKAAQPLSEILGPIDLDPLTVADHRSEFLAAVKAQKNLPDYIQQGLPKLY